MPGPRPRLAFACHALAIALLAGFGLTYLLRSEFLPYHAAAVGRPWAAVEPAFQALILALLRVVGGACLALVTLLTILLLGPFRRGETWARWAIPLGGWVFCAGAVLGMAQVALRTPGRPPWPAPVLGAALLGAGLLLSLSAADPRSERDRRGTGTADRPASRERH